MNSRKIKKLLNFGVRIHVPTMNVLKSSKLENANPIPHIKERWISRVSAIVVNTVFKVAKLFFFFFLFL